jgi:hypothetical protein
VVEGLKLFVPPGCSTLVRERMSAFAGIEWTLLGIGVPEAGCEHRMIW